MISITTGGDLKKGGTRIMEIHLPLRKQTAGVRARLIHSAFENLADIFEDLRQ